MRKIIILVAVLGILITPGYSKDKRVGISIGAGYHQYSGIVKEVYSGSNISFSGDFSYLLGKSFEMFFHADLLNMNGKLTYSDQDTKLSLTSMEAGLRIPFGKKVQPYIGGGAGSYSFKETNDIGEASGSGFGFFGEAGIKIKFSSMFFDIKGKYVSLKIDSVDLSGVKLITIIGVLF